MIKLSLFSLLPDSLDKKHIIIWQIREIMAHNATLCEFANFHWMNYLPWAISSLFTHLENGIKLLSGIRF